MNDSTYAPPRDLKAKIQRRVTQATRAQPAHLFFDAPILSICFDDFPHSAAVAGAAILERHDARGTFYASASLAERDSPCGPGFTREDLMRLHADGHEIACHGYSHLDCARADVFEALHDIARNRDALSAFGHSASLQSFAYPYGETKVSLKETLPPRFACARGITPGLNYGKVDLAQLKAFPLYGAGGLKRVHSVLKRTVRKHAWLIAFTHDVSDTPSPFGTTPRDLEALVVEAKAQGLQILPISQALARAEILV